MRTACAEVDYWRWRFLVDSTGLADGELLTQHMVFAAQVEGLSIDLLTSPWVAARAHWTHPDDDSATQPLAHAAREHDVGWLRYESVRDTGGVCCAVLSAPLLGGPEPGSQQTWHCRTTRQAVRMVHGDDRFEWQMTGEPIPDWSLAKPDVARPSPPHVTPRPAGGCGGHCAPEAPGHLSPPRRRPH